MFCMSLFKRFSLYRLLCYGGQLRLYRYQRLQHLITWFEYLLNCDFFFNMEWDIALSP